MVENQEQSQRTGDMPGRKVQESVKKNGVGRRNCNSKGEHATLKGHFKESLCPL